MPHHCFALFDLFSAMFLHIFLEDSFFPSFRSFLEVYFQVISCYSFSMVWFHVHFGVWLRDGRSRA